MRTSKAQRAATWSGPDEFRALLCPIADLIPAPGNAKMHDGHQVELLAGSLKRFGQRKTVVVQRNGNGTTTLRAGHGTRLAALHLGWTHLAAVGFDDDDADARAFALADNRLAELSTWDPDALQLEITELGDDFEPADLGWTATDLKLAGIRTTPAPEAEVDPEPEAPPETPVTKPGDLYQLGPHRLICGDCRDPDVVEKLMGGRRVNVAFTSPPYASQRKYDENSGFKLIRPDDYVEWFEPVQANVKASLARDGSWFVNIAESSSDGWKLTYVKRLILQHVDAWGWGWVEEYCWPRPAFPMDPNSSRRFKNGWESVLHFATARDYKFKPEAVRHKTDRAFRYADQKAGGKTVKLTQQGVGGNAYCPVELHSGLAFPSNVLLNPGKANVVGHSAAFPVALPTFFIRAFSDPGDAVFDPFVGSGTTIIACEVEDRVGYGVEISPGYCDLIVGRWEKYTGRKATLEGGE